MITEAFKDMTAWQKKLRPGACDDLLDDITSKAKSLWNDADSGIDTPMLQSIVQNILKLRKDASLQEIAAALESKSAGQARDVALAKFAQALEGFATLDDLEKVHSAWLPVQDMRCSQATQMQMHNFRGHMVEAFQVNFKAVLQRTDVDSSRMQVAKAIAKGFDKSIEEADLKSVRCSQFLACLDLALDVKTALHECTMEIDDGGVKPES
jgi:hypothetical protein